MTIIMNQLKIDEFDYNRILEASNDSNQALGNLFNVDNLYLTLSLILSKFFNVICIILSQINFIL